jgi:type IV pilus assembly protein PilV
MANQIRTYDEINKPRDEQNPYLSLNYKSGIHSAALNIACLGTQETCDAAELAKFSIYEWETKIKENLPEGRGLICRDAEPWDKGEGEYKWECTQSQDNSAPLVIKLGWLQKKTNQGKFPVQGKNFPPSMVLVVGSL